MNPAPASLKPSRPGWDFSSCAWLALAGLAPVLDEDIFWDLLDEIGWGPRASAQRAAKALVRRIAVADCAGAMGCARGLSRRLAERLEQWEYERGQPLGLSDDRFMVLVDHLIGLGQATFLRVQRDPALVMKWVRQAKLRAGVQQVFTQTTTLYPVEELREALAALGEPADLAGTERLADQQIVQHPEHGLGVALVRSDETRVVFEAGDLVV